jgi:hypothetical protein
MVNDPSCAVEVEMFVLFFTDTVAPLMGALDFSSITFPEILVCAWTNWAKKIPKIKRSSFNFGIISYLFE